MIKFSIPIFLHFLRYRSFLEILANFILLRTLELIFLDLHLQEFKAAINFSFFQVLVRIGENNNKYSNNVKKCKCKRVDKRGKPSSHPGNEFTLLVQAEIAICTLSSNLYPTKVVWLQHQPRYGMNAGWCQGGFKGILGENSNQNTARIH